LSTKNGNQHTRKQTKRTKNKKINQLNNLNIKKNRIILLLFSRLLHSAKLKIMNGIISQLEII